MGQQRLESNPKLFRTNLLGKLRVKIAKQSSHFHFARHIQRCLLKQITDLIRSQQIVTIAIDPLECFSEIQMLFVGQFLPECLQHSFRSEKLPPHLAKLLSSVKCKNLSLIRDVWIERIPIDYHISILLREGQQRVLELCVGNLAT